MEPWSRTKFKAWYKIYGLRFYRPTKVRENSRILVVALDFTICGYTPSEFNNSSSLHQGYVANLEHASASKYTNWGRQRRA